MPALLFGIPNNRHAEESRVMMLKEHLLGWRRVRLKEYRRWEPFGFLMSGPSSVLTNYHLLCRGQNRPWQ